jgi:hypothetical protein
MDDESFVRMFPVVLDGGLRDGRWMTHGPVERIAFAEREVIQVGIDPFV